MNSVWATGERRKEGDESSQPSVASLFTRCRLRSKAAALYGPGRVRLQNLVPCPALPAIALPSRVSLPLRLRCSIFLPPAVRLSVAVACDLNGNIVEMKECRFASLMAAPVGVRCLSPVFLWISSCFSPHLVFAAGAPGCESRCSLKPRPFFRVDSHRCRPEPLAMPFFASQSFLFPRRTHGLLFFLPFSRSLGQPPSPPSYHIMRQDTTYQSP